MGCMHFVGVTQEDQCDFCWERGVGWVVGRRGLACSVSEFKTRSSSGGCSAPGAQC